MDNLVLIRVAAALGRELNHAALQEAREEGRHRLRLVFAGRHRIQSLLVSLRPELPWIGRPARRQKKAGQKSGKFAAAINRALKGLPVASVEKPTFDRWISIRFTDGQSLVAELATHRANLVLVDAAGEVLAAARNPRSSRERIAVGRPFRPAALPSRLLVPADETAEGIDRFLRVHGEEDSPFELLRRRFFGVGSEGSRLVVDESAATGRTVGQVLVSRLAALERGELDPVLIADADPLELAESGRLEAARVRLLPWEPREAGEAGPWQRGKNPAATAGWFHEALERSAEIERRLGALRTLLSKETDRLGDAEDKVARDLEGFEDPARYRLRGEALLAGLGRVRRVGEVLMVPDPYDAEGTEIAVPASRGQSPQVAAEEQFRRHRKARRGKEQARKRKEWLAARQQRLKEIAWDHEQAAGAAGIEALEGSMRSAGMPVGLEPATRAGRAAAREGNPRLEGVRLYTSGDGLTILAGRSGPANHRLTFKLAAPDDFWLHAADCPGAHVVIRNDQRRAKPPTETLHEAAALAAWFSEAKNQEYADVRWTRRKYVRRPRGAAPGTVVLKRFETVRVRPGLPPGADE